MLKVITAPEEIITTDEVADFVRAEFSAAEETLVEGLITSARQWCEEYLRRAIGVQTLELRLKGFPANGGPIVLRSPLLSVTSIKYRDADYIENTLDATDYIVSDSEPACVYPASAWPFDYGLADSVVVVYRAGYYPGGSPKLSEILPKTIKTAMLMMIADMYANREAQVEKPLVANPTVERLISMFRLEQGQ